MKQCLKFFCILALFLAPLYGAAEMPEQPAQAMAVHKAVRIGGLDRLRALYANGADLNAVDDMGQTPLHLAVVGDNLHIVEFLIRCNAAVNTQDCYGATPLSATVPGNRVYVAALLLRNGAFIETRDCGGETPFFTAAAYGNCEVLSLLAMHGADVTASNIYQKTPLLYALLNAATSDQEIKNYTNVVNFLLTFGVPVDETELEFLKKLYPEYATWLRSKRVECEQLLKKTVVQRLPSVLRELIFSFMLSDISRKRKCVQLNSQAGRLLKRCKHV